MKDAVPVRGPLGTLAAPHWTVGDRLVGFAALAPARVEPPVVLAVSPGLAGHLLGVWPDAVVLDDDPHLEVAAGAAGLVVLEAGERRRDEMVRLLRPDGHLVVLDGGRADAVAYPDAEHSEMLWRRGWPVTVHHGLPSLVRRWARLHAGAGTAVEVHGPAAPSLAEEVVADVSRHLGRTLRLAGVVTAGVTVLRATGPGGDVAVTLELGAPDDRTGLVDAVRADVPALGPYLVPELARGTTQGRGWRAAPWLAGPGHRPAAGAGQRAHTTASVAALLAGHRTGSTETGWAERWAEVVHVLPPPARAAWAAAMAPLDAGLPTGWCHGDLWPGNVLVGDDAAVVIDWANASPDAPLGIDGLLLAAAGAPDPVPVGPTSPGAADTLISRVLGLVDDVDPAATLTVAGRPWPEWDRPARVALAVAGVALHLRNRSFGDLDPRHLRSHLDDVDRLISSDAPVPRTPGAAAADDRTEASRTARGAVWLATSGVVVKASQTVVLLALAAVLAPSALGVVALGTLVANLSAVVASLGTASALVYWRGDVARAARTALTIGVGTGAALAAALWLAAPGLAELLRAPDGGTAVIRGLTVTLPCLAVAAVTNELLRRRLAFARRILPDTVSSIVGAAVAVALVVHGTGVMALVAGQVVQGVLTMLLAWVVHPPVLPGWNRDDARALLAYGAPYGGANLLDLVQLNVDYLIVSRVLGGIALGQYSLAFRIAYMPYLMIVVVTTGAAFPYLCRMRGPGLARASEVVMGSTMTLVLPAGVLLALMADHLTVLGAKWQPAVTVLALLASYAVLLGVSSVVLTVLNGAGRPGSAMGLKLLHLASLTVVLLLVARHGITAVAVAQVVVALAMAVVALVVARRQVVGLSIARMLSQLRPAVLACVAMAVVVEVLRHTALRGSASVASLVVVGLAAAVTFAAGVWLLDRNSVREAASMLRGRP